MVAPGLARVLDRDALPKLLALEAPPGYGKTVAMSVLHVRQLSSGRRTLWVSLDDRDRTLADLASLIMAASAEHVPGLAAGVGAGAHGPQGADDHDLVPDRLLAALDRLEGPTALFLDNVQFCDDAAVDLLRRLVFDSPPSLRLVVSSTTPIPLDLARAKLELGACVLGIQDLSFDRERLARFFGAAGDPLRDEPLLDLIEARTEGWPAAARLLLVLGETSGGIDRAVARFTGEDADVASVLTRRVLAGFEPSVTRFLYRIALFREFSAELAVHVTRQRQSGAWLNRLAERNLLIFPLDRTRRWFRMHTLLRQFLLVEGRAYLEPQRTALLERGARWHAERGENGVAIDLALEASSFDLAARLLDGSAQVHVEGFGRLPQFTRWVESLARAGAEVSLDTRVWYAWALCFSLRYEDARDAIAGLRRRLATQRRDPASRSALLKRIGLLEVVVGTYLDALDASHRAAVDWLRDTTGQDAFSVATVATAAAIAETNAYRFPQARRSMAQAAAAIARSDSAYGRAWVTAVRACIDLCEGEPMLADRSLSECRTLVESSLGGDSSGIATMDFVHSRALFDLGRREQADTAARRGLRRMGQHGVIETVRHGIATCVSLWDGGQHGPFSPTELNRMVIHHGPRLADACTALQVRRLIHLGRGEEARALARRSSLASITDIERAGSRVLDGEIAGALIELAIATGDERQASVRLAARLAFAARTGALREQVDLLLIATALDVGHGEMRLARRSFTRAIVAAAPRRLVGPFLEHLPTVGRVLGGSKRADFGLTREAELEFVDALEQAARIGSTRDAALPVPAGDAYLPPLTPRETTLLALLDQGLTNQQIADRTDLTVATVKWHLYNLFAKLSVKSRAGAVAIARSAGLLHH